MAIVLTIHKPGWYTTLQDAGRPGQQQYGIPSGGWLDKPAAQRANKLVGNPVDTPVLEMTLTGPTLQISAACTLALTGADFDPRLNGKRFQNNRPLVAPANSMLEIGSTHRGCRGYLAVRGDWQVPQLLGSCAPLPGWESDTKAFRALRAGDTFHLSPTPPVFGSLPVTESILPNASPIVVRVMPGPEYGWFSPAADAIFSKAVYRITPDCSRMGIRLDGPALLTERSLISSAVLPGTVQLPPAGRPIILLADAQTTGGYPRYAQVREADLAVLAQVRPGDQVRFSFD